MTKNEMKSRISTAIRDSGYRKLVKSPRHVFHISDDEGNSKDFVVRPSEREVSITADDVEQVINTLIDVICDEIKHGNPVSLFGFGSFGLRYNPPRQVPRFDGQGCWEYEGQYVPKFKPGEKLRAASRMYSQTLSEKMVDIGSMPYDEDDDPSIEGEEN